MQVNEEGDAGRTISADVKDGIYRILFNHDRVGFNLTSQEEWVLPAIEAASSGGFSLAAKNSIATAYTEQIEELQKEIAQITGIVDVVLDPNFEENYKTLSEKATDSKWHSRFGHVHYGYFNGLKGQLESQGMLTGPPCEERLLRWVILLGFKKDDMLQEGLQEALPSKV